MTKPSAHIQEQFRIWQEASADKRLSIANDQAAMEIIDLAELAELSLASVPLTTTMVNGKPLSECTGDEMIEIGEWYKQLGEAHQRCIKRLSLQ